MDLPQESALRCLHAPARQSTAFRHEAPSLDRKSSLFDGDDSRSWSKSRPIRCDSDLWQEMVDHKKWLFLDGGWPIFQIGEIRKHHFDRTSHRHHVGSNASGMLPNSLLCPFDRDVVLGKKCGCRSATGGRSFRQDSGRCRGRTDLAMDFGPCTVLTTSHQHRYASMYSTAEPPVTIRSPKLLFRCCLEEHKPSQAA